MKKDINGYKIDRITEYVLQNKERPYHYSGMNNARSNFDEALVFTGNALLNSAWDWPSYSNAVNISLLTKQEV